MNQALGDIILLSACLQISATCHFPDGTVPSTQKFPGHPATEYAPCNNNTEFSMCCRTNIDLSTGKGSTCRGDGLCNLQEDQTVYRDTCTDPTWQSTACIPLCITGRGNTIPFGGTRWRLYDRGANEER